MKKIILTIYQITLFISIFEYFITDQSKAFIPVINEPNLDELKYTSIEIGKTAIQLIQFGQNDEAIKLLKLAVKLNPKEIDLWITLAEAQIRSNKQYEALSSLNKVIKLKPKEYT